MGVVIGREAHRVGAAQANDYIFGYTLENDVSDRGGRGDNRYGSDWVVGKSHDTFAPLGPFITPKEFVSDPRKVAITVDLNGMRIQEGSSSLMIHDVYEQVAYGSNIITLRPGDVIATGTPAGVGSARTPPVFLKSGDRISCTYEGVGHSRIRCVSLESLIAARRLNRESWADLPEPFLHACGQTGAEPDAPAAPAAARFALQADQERLESTGDARNLRRVTLGSGVLARNLPEVRQRTVP